MPKKTAAKAHFASAALPSSQPAYPERLLLYVMPWDTGMAPNVTGGLCTLATCKPEIRKSAKLCRDWVVAVGAVKTLMSLAGGKKRYENWKDRLTYVMAPDERLNYDDYFRDPRFAVKIPRGSGDPGDNLYHRDKKSGQFEVSPHVNDIHRADDRLKLSPGFAKHDLKAAVALVAHEFWYWGENAPHLADTGLQPKTIETLMSARRGHRVITDPAVIHDLVDWLRPQKPGIHGQPRQRHLLSEFHL